jgi:hypothetical protein
MAAEQPLACPSCATTHAADQRFCPECGMPLVLTGGEALVSSRQERARKIKPQFTEGELVRVAYARHQAEAELIQGILLEEGVPSMLRRARGFDVPDMLAAGPRDVMVAASGADTARDVLLRADMGASSSAPGRVVESPARLLMGLCAFIALVAVVAWVGTELIA